MHLGGAYRSYYCYKYLNSDLKVLKNLDFLFINDFKELVNKYELDRDSTRKFLKRIKIYTAFMNFIIICFKIFFSILVGRCIYFFTIPTVGLTYYFTIGLIFIPVTFSSFFNLTECAFKFYTLIFTTIEFLILRIYSLEKMVLKEFNMSSLSVLPKNRTVVKDKRNPKSLRVLKKLNEFILNFKNIDPIFDKALVSF